MNQDKDYRISLFKPTTEFSRINRNLVLTLIVIWAVAIFGFQILLRVMQTPTPEPALQTFQKVWNNVESGIADSTEMVMFTDAVISVLGKSSTYTDAKRRPALVNAFSWAIYQLIEDSVRTDFKIEIKNFEALRKKTESLEDNAYVNAKASIIAKVAPLLGWEEYSLKARLIPLELKSDDLEIFTAENEASLPATMELYLTHNRSVLTDTVFLGFPFHYFYTAIFLLVLFVVLCWIYCFAIDRVHTKMGTYNKPGNK
ncbi:MAG: DUF4212 domain-containing protein [Candidatus Cloacimonetes bacterium]|nr:DUF4212 domain-containing protein [Candidatus Cloacimonadota bacterium]